MANKPIQFQTNAVRQIRPLDLKKRELFEEVGRAVVHLSNVENWLANIAYHVTFPDAGMKVPQLFFSLYGFEKPLQFVDLIVDLHASDQVKRRWNAITATLSHHKGIRNFIAHNPMSSSLIRAQDGNYDVYLRSHDLNRKGPHEPSKAIKISDIRATASALEKIGRELEALWNEIDDERWPLRRDTDYDEK